MTPMNKPELPPEAVHWTVFNESEALAVIMRAQNYINDELLRKWKGWEWSEGTSDLLVTQELRSVNLTLQQQQQQQQQKKNQNIVSV